MSSAFPQTPVSLLARISEKHEEKSWHHAWREFWNLYHLPLQFTVLAKFRRHGWYSISDALLEDVLAEVMHSFIKAEFTYQSEQGKLRDFLGKLAERRVIDHLRKSSREITHQQTALETLSQEELTGLEELEKAEHLAYRQAQLASLLEDVRARVSPQTFLFFELTKLHGHSPVRVAKDYQVKRNVVDNAVARVIRQLQQLASLPEYQDEFLL